MRFRRFPLILAASWLLSGAGFAAEVLKTAAPSGWGGFFAASPDVLGDLGPGQPGALTRLLDYHEAFAPGLLPAADPAAGVREQLSAAVRAVVNEAHRLSGLAEASESVRQFSNPHDSARLAELLDDVRAVLPLVPELDAAALAPILDKDQAGLRALARRDVAGLAAARKPAFEGGAAAEEALPASDGPSPRPSPAEAGLQKAPAEGSGFDLPDIVFPKHIDTVEFGGERFPAFAAPTHMDIPALLAKFVSLSQETLVGFYEFGLDEMADAFVEAARKGSRQILVGDFSNILPEKLSPAEHGAQHRERTPQMQTLVDNLGNNLQLSVLKGIGSIGINHNKFIIGKDRNGKKVLVRGSFNFTPTSQRWHWEILSWTDDPLTIALYETFHQWMQKIARPFSEGLKPEDPDLSLGGPIPRDPDPSVEFNGRKFPRASFSPQGGTMDWLIAATQVMKEALYIVMFSYFPPKALEAEIAAAMDRGVSLRILADAGQAHNASALVRAMQKGGEVRLIAGPDEAPYDPKAKHRNASKQHMKLYIADRGKWLKGYDSTNISGNAFFHNFENAAYFADVLARMLFEYADSMWELGYAPSLDELKKIVAGNHQRQEAEGRAVPWGAGAL